MNPFSTWQRWMLSEDSVSLRQLESGWYAEAVEEVFGYHALQISPPGLFPLQSSRIGCRSHLHFHEPIPEVDPGCSELVSDPAVIPMESDSLDLVVLAHALEAVADPHALLREVERVLVPEGRLLVTGFSPVSLWALAQPRSPGLFPPIVGDWIHPRRLRDWCRLLALEPSGGGFGLYRPPLAAGNLYDRLAWMELAGARWWPSFGSLYHFEAVKRRSRPLLIKPWAAETARQQARVTAVSSTRTTSID